MAFDKHDAHAHWTVIFRGVPGYEWFRSWHPRSWVLFVVAAVAAALALAYGAAFDWHDAKFARERVEVTGRVVSSWFVLPTNDPSDRPQEFCYTRYQITVKEVSHRGWHLGGAGCWLKPDAPIRIEYVASNPDINRMVGATTGGRFLIKLLWALSIGFAVWGVLQRRAEGPMVGSGGPEVAGRVESITRDREGHFVLTYSYEAGVRGTHYGQCQIDHDSARRLKPGTSGRVMVDPIHPSRSDWIGLGD